MTISIFIALNVTVAFLLSMAGILKMIEENRRMKMNWWAAFFLTSTFILGLTMVGTWTIATSPGINIW